jgi:uncharacterized membrane protein YdfJ with MMPL/SSD domain
LRIRLTRFFIVSRYRDELQAALPTEQALSTALETTGTPFFSRASRSRSVSEGSSSSRARSWRRWDSAESIDVGFAVAFAFTFLPAVLVALGPRIDAVARPAAALREPRRRLAPRSNLG